MLNPSQSQSLFEQIGGKATVDAAVDIFYTKILTDDRISHFFAEIGLNAQRRKQVLFLTYAFGGAPNYSGKSMRDAHKKLIEEQSLNEHHFNAVAENLQATLQDLIVPEDLQNQVMTIATST